MSAGKFPNTSGIQKWLDEWSTHNTAPCKNNPIDLSRTRTGSKNCLKLTSSRTAQDYASHASAAAAFNQQVKSGTFPNLLAVFQSGDYPSPAKLGDVLTDLQVWGAKNFVAYLEQEWGISPGGGGIGGGTVAVPRATKGWDDLRRQVNHGLPTALAKIQKLNRATSTQLARRSKVRR